MGDNRGTVESCRFIGTVIGKSDVGGIAGINRLEGTIKNSYAEGEIIGESRVGGISGSNEGLISGAENTAKVNTVSITPELSLDQLNLSLTLDINKLPSINGTTTTDIGGIAGYSTGILLGCKNYAAIGYSHIGYNVGGIVGRSSGHLANNENHGNILGRKDVGGVVGHMEPYVTYDLSEDLVAKLKNELDTLSGLIDDAISTADASLPGISGRIDKILTDLENATTSLEIIMNGVGDYGEEASKEINRASELLSETVKMLADVTAPLPELTEILFNAISDLNEAIKSLDGVSDHADAALADMKLAMQDMESSLGLLNDSLTNIKSGIAALEGAVIIDDKDAVEAAINDMLTGLTGASSALSNLSAAMNGIADALGSAPPDFAELATHFNTLGSAFSGLSDAMDKFSDGLTVISDNVSIDFVKVSEASGLISEGLDLMIQSVGYIEGAAGDIINAMSDLELMSDALGVTMGHVSNSLTHISQAMILLGDIATDVNELVNYLKGVDPIQIPALNEDIKVEVGELFVSIKSMEQELKLLNLDVTSLSDEMLDILSEINHCTERISDIVTDMVYGINGTDYISSDVSEEEIGEITYGKVFASNNFGSVYADINVGGIAGTIGIEYTLDPEDDLTAELSVTEKKHYKLKAVIHASINHGYVTSKYDAVGGIVGKMDLGTLYSCEAYSRIESESGDYVGGIAGISAGLISTSYAKCTLKGGKYVGGIVGSGVDEDRSGDSSMVRGCYSMVVIEGYEQYAGAIAGANIGEYDSNYFVSDNLTGIDRVSYQGKAEPITYEELAKRRYVPSGFHTFKLDFIVDGEIIKSVEHGYGKSFTDEIFPEIPEKDGHFGYWDTAELNSLTFDTVVNAVYKPYVTAISGGSKRENGKEIFLVSGKFTDKDTLTITKDDISCSIPELDGKLFVKYSIIERWNIIVPDDKSEKHDIHFLPTEEKIALYIYKDDSWTEIDTEELGSYVTFESEGGEIKLAVVKKSANILAILLLLLSVLNLSAATVIVTVLITRKRKKKAQ